MRLDEYRILVHSGRVSGPGWHDVGEGPWDNQENAIRHAEAEVGVPWIVIDGAHHPVAYGDAFGLDGDNT